MVGRFAVFVYLFVGLSILELALCTSENSQNSPGHSGGGGGRRLGHLHSRNYRNKKSEIVEAIRQHNKHWQADVNPDFEALDLDDFQSLLGGVQIDTTNVTARIDKHPPHGRKAPKKHGQDGANEEQEQGHGQGQGQGHGQGQGQGHGRGNNRQKRGTLPSSYDVRNYFPVCKSIGSIRYQYRCSSCWAVTAASLMSDRHCIYNYNRVGQLYFSPLQIISCVPRGCDGGKEWDAYDYWIRNGLVSGGTAYANANQPTGCLPYPYGINATPTACPRTCSVSYTKTFDQDKVYGGQYYLWWFPSVEQIKQEIYSYGPVAAFFTAYDDLFYYKSGIYEPTSKTVVGYHLAKLIGWGTENGIDYWLAVNTWGTNWGQNGLFKIRRGNNTSGIEARITAVLPREGL